MSITVDNIAVRPTVDVLFHPDSELSSLFKESLAKINSMGEQGLSTYVVTISSDQLTRTSSFTCSDTNTFNQFYDSINSVALGAEIHQYFVKYGGTGKRTISGSDVESRSFNIKTIYSFPAGTDVSLITSYLSSNIALTPSNVIVQTDSITAVHTYSNAENFNSQNYFDMRICEQLIPLGVTKTHEISFN